MTIRTKAASKEYRDGWERVFGDQARRTQVKEMARVFGVPASTSEVERVLKRIAHERGAKR